MTKSPLKDKTMKLYHTDGKVEDIPLDQSLKNLQQLVRGYIEYCPMPKGVKTDIIVNEDGGFAELPLNKAATEFYKNLWLQHHKESELDLDFFRLYGNVVVVEPC